MDPYRSTSLASYNHRESPAVLTRGSMHVSWRKRISRLIRGKMRAQVLSKHGEGILANTRNGLLVVDPRDFGLSRALLTRGSYDWSEIKWLCGILSDRSRL